MQEECDTDKRHAIKTKIKHDLHNVLYSPKLCGLCFSTPEEICNIGEQFEIYIHKQKLNVSLYDIISKIFKDVEDILFSQNVCSKCIDNLLLSYKFIQNTKAATKIMHTYLDDFCGKVNDVSDLMKSSVRQESSVVIVLENTEPMKIESSTDIREDDNLENGYKVENEYESFKTDPEMDTDELYICKDCNIILPSLKKRELHQLKYHHKELQCKFCSKGFKSVNYLNVHYKTHSATLCKICHEVVFHSKIVRHLKENHKDSVYSCNVCNTVCYSISALEAHINISHKDSESDQCIMCLQTFEVDKLSSHRCKFKCPECTDMPCMHYKYLMAYRQQILNKETKVSCVDCDYVCTKKYSLLGHVNKEHLNRHAYACDHCPRTFYSKTLLTAHIQLLHMERFGCEYCDSEFTRKINCEHHRETCKLTKREFACDQCEASFDTPKKLSEHTRVRHCDEVYPCKICGKKLLSESKRKEHVTRVHGSSAEVLNVKCGLCDAAFDSKRTMQLHIKRHGENMIYRCKICNADFDNLRKLRVHSRRHTAPLATCKVCGKVTRDIYMKKHMETHKPPKFYTCEACGKSVKGIQQYKYHVKHHLIRVPCPDCSLLMHPASLRRHRLSRHSDVPASVINKPKAKTRRCEYCDFTTTSKTIIECHTNKHHKKVKPYICHICSKDFTGRHLLQRHIERHDTDKTVSCRLCSKTFANDTCLKMHLRLHTGEKPYPCDICGQRFRSSSILNVHKETKHSEKNNACPLCNNKYHTIREMRSHVIKVHWRNKDRRFDPRDLDGLDEKDYHLFHDGRRSIIVENELEFFTPSVPKSLE